MSYNTGLVFAAIDFGTTYSGYAYSLRDELNKDPLTIYTNKPSNDGEGLVTMKAPTVILFEPDGQFHSFGFEAENKYAELAENDCHSGWRYFRRFKMMLYSKRALSRSTTLRDDQGNPMKAMDVFGAAIGCLKQDLMKQLTDRISDIRETDISWVLTVPAIWHDSAKQFMREAATKAGIADDQLTLALEPEAAAVYCKEVEVSLERDVKGASVLSCFKAGSKFLIIDLGGGTADITAHGVQRDGTLMELTPPSGGPWGGTTVDDAFYSFLEDLFTGDVMKSFTADDESKVEDLELQRVWELKKRKVSDNGGKLYLKLPNSLCDLFKEMKDCSIEQQLKKDQFASTIEKKRDKLHIENSIMVKLFEKSVDNLKQHLKRILQQPNLRQVKTMMLVGGFSDSEVVKSAIKAEFPAPRFSVITPPDAGLAVLKGAVIYGFNPRSITSRKMSFTYGISTAVPFDDRMHPLSKRVVRDGNEKCEDVFKVFIRAGEGVVPRDTTRSFTFNTPFTSSSNATVEIYKTAADSPRFVTDEGCRKMGQVLLDLPRSGRQLIDVTMSFGDTELHVEAKEQNTGSTIAAKFNFLN